MPELPEVEVVRAGLAPVLAGAQVTEVTVFDERSLRRHPGPSEDFVDRLTGRVTGVPARRGKFMWVPLDGADEALVMHLGMSGQMLLRSPGATDRNTRIRLEVAHPGLGQFWMNFVDQRIFGSLAIDPFSVADGVPSQVAHIARDPLDPAFDDAAFIARLRTRKTDIKRALLDQTLISGIGNIYADEALWAARIHYLQPTNTLSVARAKTLLAEVRVVLRKALAEGGTSFDSQYLNVNGQAGYFAAELNVYGRNSQDCSRCGNTITRIRFMGRYSHLCLVCQRKRG